MFSIGNWRNFALLAPQFTNMAAIAKDKSCVFFRSCHTRTYLFVGKSCQKMKMDGINAERDNFDFLINQHLNQRLSGNFLSGLVKMHRRLLQPLPIAIMERFGSFLRRVFVIPFNVPPVVFRTPTARVARQPSAIGIAIDMVPAVPSIHAM